MPTKAQIYAQMADETARTISQDHRQWTAFLTTAARVYKYDYEEQLLIYAQKPDATACAEYAFWNQRMRRYVKKNTHGIGLLKESANGLSVRYVFDVSDTGGRRDSVPVILWSLNDSNRTAVSNALAAAYDAPADQGLPVQLDMIAKEMAQNYWNDNHDLIIDSVDGSYLEQYDDFNVGASFRGAAQASISYALQSRCGLQPEETFGHDDFIHVFDWNTPDAMLTLGTAISQSANTVLRQIGDIIKDYERSAEHDRTDLQADGRRPGAGPGSDRGGAETPGQIRHDADELSEGTQENPVQPPAADWQADGTPARDRPDGEREAGSSDAQRPEASGAHESDESAGLGTGDERPQEPGGGDDLLGADLQLNDPANPVVEQMSFFMTEAEQIRLIDAMNAESAQQAPFAFSFDQSVNDSFLIHGSNTTDHRIHLALDFMKQKPIEAIAEHMQKLYHGGYGITLQEGSFSAWYNENGIHIARGKSAQYSNFSQHISWEDAAKRVGQLMEDGQFVSTMELATAPAFERRVTAQALWYMYRDINQSDQGYLPSMERIRGGGFPDETARLADLLADPVAANQLIAEADFFVKAYEADREIMRFHFHSPQRLLEALKEITLPRREYTAWIPEHPAPDAFITQDEVSANLTSGSSTAGGKGRIYQFFSGTHTDKERSDMLKHEYGIGGRSHGVSNSDHSSESHDSKGIELSKQFCPTVKLSWSQAAKTINDLIRTDRYLSAEEKEKYIPARPDPQEEYAAFNEPVIEAEGTVTDGEAEQDTETQEAVTAPEEEPADTVDDMDEEYIGFDTAAIRQRLEESGIVNGEIVDEEALRNTPIIQEVEALARAISEQEEGNAPTPVPTHLIFPSRTYYQEGDKVYFDGHAFILEEIDKFGVRLRDPDLVYPVFRAESWENFERLLHEDERNAREVPGTDEIRLQTVILDLTATAEHEPVIPVPTAGNYHITDDHLGEGGAKAKYVRNAAAIMTLKQIESENRTATPEEQHILAQYVGWGGIPQAFDAENPDWSGEHAELRSLLTPSEYEAARASTLNAHYTSPVVIRAMYDALDQMGFKSGNILEPSCGVGNFFGMLPEQMQASRLYGVELDSITGRIAQQLYPDANITISGFEKTDRRDFFDVAIGNVPFGSYKVSDRQFDRYNFLIHDYFFGKALDQVRPGGVVAFITSKGTLDKQSPEVRRYIAQRAELLGAIRLPNDAFKRNAGTEVTSDIIFLQKREHPITIEPDWVHLGQTEDGIPVNSYFADHPDMILGKMVWDDSMYGSRTETACLPIEGADLAQQLAEAVQKITGEYREAERPDIASEDDAKTMPADPSVPNYSYTIVDGTIYYRSGSVMTEPTMNQVAKERVRGMIGLRDCVRELIHAQMEGGTDEEISALQGKLNQLYDTYTAKYGLLNSRGNANAFSEDASYYLLCSLEEVNDKGELIRKADMFSKRTIRQHQVVDHCDTAAEALAVSISEKAGVDLHYMAELTGKSEDDLISDLEGVIFPVPGKASLHDSYVTADDYLSGNIRHKLRDAKEAAAANPLYEANVTALEGAMPKDLDASEIDIRLGATWVKKEYIQQFMFDTFTTPAYLQRYINVQYSNLTAEWNITGKTMISSNNIAAYVTYGTDRANAYRILEDTLNLRDVRIYDTVTDPDGKERRVLNAKATTLAQQKQQAIKDAFAEWIWRDPTRREELTTTYNELFNSSRPREYDGSHIAFGGMNPEINLREHQRNAVAHILYGGNTLLAHQVGAGKTFEITASIMESRRLGLCQKAMIVVPNHLTEQWASEFLRLYPSANLLVTTKKDFEKVNRLKFCARIATGDYDAIIIGHSQFERIPVSLERQQQLLRDQIQDVVEGIQELKMNRGEKFSIKQLEKTKRQLEARLKKLDGAEKKDHVVTFEELGVDRLYVDEAQAHKNLFLYTKMRNVAGLSQSESQRASDMFMKCRYLDEITGGRGVIFATGTPISNSMTELYTMQRYLQYNTLMQKNMTQFDSWASTFGETTTAMELAPEGTGYRARTRFSKFFNLPELMTIFKEVADIKMADQLHLPTPNPHYETVVVPPSDIQREMIQELSKRAAEVHSGAVDPSVDNMLTITSDGRKLGLDQRLMNPLLPDNPDSKVNACVRNVYRIWEEGQADRLTQLIFCDLSTPCGKNAPVAEAEESAETPDQPEISEGSFSVYDDIRGKLMQMGIPKEEIAFIHEAKTEAQKKDLFAKVRSGEVRVLMGSTAKMGAGTNVQTRLVASHDLDCPWRPGDLEQRAGRIVRQGNQNKDVTIYRYVTEASFDSYLWQTVENKQRFISQIMTSKSPVRSCEDVDETALSYAEIKALCAGDPRIKEKMDLDVDVSRLKLMKADHQSKQYRLQDKLLKSFPQDIEQTKKLISCFEQDIATLSAHPLPEKDFIGMKVQGHVIFDKEEAGKAILEACKQAAARGKPVDVGTYRGFDVRVVYDTFTNKFNLMMKGVLTHQAEVGTDPRGNILRMDNALATMPASLEKQKGQLANLEQQVQDAQVQVAKPFPQEEELKTKSARLAELNAVLNIEQASTSAQIGPKSEKKSVMEQLRQPSRPGTSRFHHHDREAR